MSQVSIQVRVPFVDVDSTGRIHFTAMMRYWEKAEHALMRALGLPYITLSPALAFPRVHVSCDFKRAVRYDDELTVEAWIARVGRSSWTVEFAAYFTSEYMPAARDEARASVATGRMTIVTVGQASEQPIPLPDELRAILTAAAESEQRATTNQAEPL